MQLLLSRATRVVKLRIRSIILLNEQFEATDNDLYLFKTVQLLYVKDDSFNPDNGRSFRECCK